MPRFATIDIGTNSVLLLVAERTGDGRFEAVLERAEITRLGRGVDATRRLSAEGMEATLSVLEAFAREAREQGAQDIAVSATSAARDAVNGAEFLEAAKTRAGVTVEIISGQLEAELSFAAVSSDFSGEAAGPLLVLDIGGGSTEFIYGNPAGHVDFRHSFDVGAVRLTERFVRSDPMSAEDRARIQAHLRDTFKALPPPPPASVLVGVAGTVTTVYAVKHAIDPYDAARVHGGTLSVGELSALVDQLCQQPLEERRTLPGMQPKRADVIPAGALILLEAVKALGLDGCRVSDRGLRWGLLAHRFGAGASRS
ncbi:Ppx/GppA phosphatase family protein [Myxococcus sp. MISCRS1]|uniref:Ppx/GppA phosphatase family protein n=1 Tax=unclassified Myxococcus TaxID=2648731 RepID=UPI001CBC1703|nr:MULTISPECIES: Ppx/GppA phosphatase family protein [unclassified Myxococcus]MBZ4394634.1 Ppx/GppA family phosphatase [Myxococcus sp. AS-1-15]MCY1001605.1 Ppx/GppA phosphatase family protein [Myxococcus sp. MISCRS1]BDT36823.1 Ppx/GppA family phosphatase [Myxococcus sp. MH1]